MAVRTCEICGKNLQSNNKSGLCQSTLKCQAEKTRRFREANPEYQSSYARRINRENVHEELTYLMYSPGLNTHKIGHTVNLRSRQFSLRNGCWDIELVTTFPYGRKLENWLHGYFHAKRIPGTEWFSDLTEVDVKNAVAEYESTLK